MATKVYIKTIVCPYGVSLPQLRLGCQQGTCCLLRLLNSLQLGQYPNLESQRGTHF